MLLDKRGNAEIGLWANNRTDVLYLTCNSVSYDSTGKNYAHKTTGLPMKHFYSSVILIFNVCYIKPLLFLPLSVGVTESQADVQSTESLTYTNGQQ